MIKFWGATSKQVFILFFKFPPFSSENNSKTSEFINILNTKHLQQKPLLPLGKISNGSSLCFCLLPSMTVTPTSKFLCVFVSCVFASREHLVSVEYAKLKASVENLWS